MNISSVLARETQPSPETKERPQAVVSAEAAPKPEKATPPSFKAPAATNSVDFLMEEPPLTKSTTMEPAVSGTAPNAIPAAAGPTPSVLPDLPFKRTDEVAMLISEQCTQGGTAADGTTSCSRVYSNGHHATVLTQNVNEGDEVKSQTLIEEFDEDQNVLFRKTIRHRVDYNYVKDQKAKEKEFFDIIYQPAGNKATRELMVYEYFLETGKARSLSWSQYKQIGHEPRAELTYHSVLRYGNDGNPERGLAERWRHGIKTATFMNWSRRVKGFATLDEEAWGQWEGWIRNVSLQAYLP
ncbi:MAG: hypothetical protein PHV97_04645 [Candidatus Omnitrophica bacterium]|nr:hypothetical protein [Candidatus Omnitrophota bacterium]